MLCVIELITNIAHEIMFIECVIKIRDLSEIIYYNNIVCSLFMIICNIYDSISLRNYDPSIFLKLICVR